MKNVIVVINKIFTYHGTLDRHAQDLINGKEDISLCGGELG